MPHFKVTVHLNFADAIIEAKGTNINTNTCIKESNTLMPFWKVVCVVVKFIPGLKFIFPCFDPLL